MSSDKTRLRPAHEALVEVAQAVIDDHWCIGSRVRFELQLQLREHDVIPDSHRQTVLLTIAKAACVLFSDWHSVVIGFINTQLGHDVAAITAIVSEAAVAMGTDHVARFEEDEEEEGDEKPDCTNSGLLVQVISLELLEAMDGVVRAINHLVAVNSREQEINEALSHVGSAPHPSDDLQALILSMHCQRHNVTLQHTAETGTFILCAVDPSVIIAPEPVVAGAELERDHHLSIDDEEEE